jgi:RimJ/RimL family protein N-acetyltransferase
VQLISKQREMTYPVLETKRLWLLPLFPEKQGELIIWQAAADATLASNISFRFASQQEALHFEEGFHQYQNFDRGHWAVVRKQDGLLLGWCGLRSNQKHNEADLGFRLAPAYWTHGYSAEAANECLKYAFTIAGTERINGSVKPSQAGAVKVLSQLGMTKQDAQLLERHTPDNSQVFTITKEEWISLQ